MRQVRADMVLNPMMDRREIAGAGPSPRSCRGLRPDRSRPMEAAPLFALCIALIFASLGSPTAARADDAFPVTVAGDSLALQVRAELGAEVLPDFVRERLDRGIPATVGIQVDVWRTRAGWFDSRIGRVVQRFRLSRDPWSGAYLLEGPDGPVGADSLASLLDEMIDTPIRVPFPRHLALAENEHWVEVTAVTTPLSAQDLGEVEEWISGEIGGGSGSVFGVPGGVLRIVRDLTGLGDRRMAGRSARFRVALVAGDVVWVRES